MSSISGTIITTFLLALAYGTQLFSPVVSTRLTGVGFYKLGNSIVLASLTFAFGSMFFMMGYQADPVGGWCMGILLSTNIMTYVWHRDHKSWLIWLLYVIQIVTFTLFVFHMFADSPQWIMFFFYTAALIGISNFSMILGHYYLVVPKLSEEPLIYCLYILWTVIFLRLMSSLAVMMGPGSSFLVEATPIGEGYTYNWLFISMRYLWGYLAPLILSLFTFRLCKLRSLQSATGVLYIVEFFVIVGELISIYLMAKHGLPI